MWDSDKKPGDIDDSLMKPIDPESEDDITLEDENEEVQEEKLSPEMEDKITEALDDFLIRKRGGEEISIDTYMARFKDYSQEFMRALRKAFEFELRGQQLITPMLSSTAVERVLERATSKKKWASFPLKELIADLKIAASMDVIKAVKDVAGVIESAVVQFKRLSEVPVEPIKVRGVRRTRGGIPSPQLRAYGSPIAIPTRGKPMRTRGAAPAPKAQDIDLTIEKADMPGSTLLLDLKAPEGFSDRKVEVFLEIGDRKIDLGDFDIIDGMINIKLDLSVPGSEN